MSFNDVTTEGVARSQSFWSCRIGKERQTLLAEILIIVSMVGGERCFFTLPYQAPYLSVCERSRDTLLKHSELRYCLYNIIMAAALLGCMHASLVPCLDLFVTYKCVTRLIYIAHWSLMRYDLFQQLQP